MKKIKNKLIVFLAIVILIVFSASIFVACDNSAVENPCGQEVCICEYDNGYIGDPTSTFHLLEQASESSLLSQRDLFNVSYRIYGDVMYGQSWLNSRILDFEPDYLEALCADKEADIIKRFFALWGLERFAYRKTYITHAGTFNGIVVFRVGCYWHTWSGLYQVIDNIIFTPTLGRFYTFAYVPKSVGKSLEQPDITLIFNLQASYNVGWLDREDIINIAYRNPRQGSVVTDSERVAIEFTPREIEQLCVYKERLIKETFVNNRNIRINENFGIANDSRFDTFEYLGTYKGRVVTFPGNFSVIAAMPSTRWTVVANVYINEMHDINFTSVFAPIIRE